MADVFVSYKREDEARVAPLVEALAASGLDVWWDREIAGGQAWRQSINERLDAAKCVIVVWTERSVSPAGEFVHDEAGRAKRRGILLPVRMDPVDAPIGFGESQMLDLVGWRGNQGDPRFADVQAAARAIVENGPRPAPKARQQLRVWTGAAAVLGAIAGLIGFIGDVAGLQSAACGIPGIHAVCSQFELGGVATPVEQAAWDARAPGDCAALRTHLQQFPDGAFAAEAARRLQASEAAVDPQWRPVERTLPLIVPLGEPRFATMEAARADALQRAPQDAQQICALYGQVDQYRLSSASAAPQTWNCPSAGAGGWACGFRGEARCQLEARVMREVCR